MSERARCDRCGAKRTKSALVSVLMTGEMGRLWYCRDGRGCDVRLRIAERRASGAQNAAQPGLDKNGGE